MTKSAVLVVLLGCARAAAPVVEPVAPPPGPILELGELAVMEGDSAMLKLHADGSTELGGRSMGELVWQAGPTLRADGTLQVNGAEVARVQRDGRVVDLRDHRALPFVVSADKLAMQARDRTRVIVLGDDGMLRVDGHALTEQQPHVTGADTPGKRRALLTLLAVTLAEPTKVSAAE